MTKLKLGAIIEEKPVRMTVELPGPLHRDLLAYAAILSEATGTTPLPVEKLVPPMLARFVATDRAFIRARGERS